METAHPESVIPTRAQALFAELPIELRHPLLLAMPFPHGAPSHLFELEQHVCQALDPQGSETLRCAAIRCTGVWLWRHAEDLNVEVFMSDFFRLLDRLPWSVSLLHAFAVAHIRASAMMIHRRESRESTQRIFILTKHARELPVGHLVDRSLWPCLERSLELLKKLMWRGETPLGYMECFKAAELLCLFVQYGRPMNKEWAAWDRLEFHTTTVWAYWMVLRSAAVQDPLAKMKSAGAAKMDPLQRSLYDSVLKRLSEELNGDHEAMKRAVAFCQVIEVSKGAKTHKVSSKNIAGMFQAVVEAYQASEEDDAASTLACEAEHVDGSMNASEKEAKLAWLKADAPDDTCRILSNVRCLYYDGFFNENRYQMPRLFPQEGAGNLVIVVKQRWSGYGQFALMVDHVPDVQSDGGTQCFPLYLYSSLDSDADGAVARQTALFGDKTKPASMVRNDAITAEGLAHFQSAYPGETITREDVFYYVYGLLHSPDYRERFADNLGKELPRIPRVKTAADFWAFSQAGRKLADLHLNYERVEPYPLKIDSGGRKLADADYRVEKMRYGKGKGKDKDLTTVHYNDKITLTGIPLEAYDYVVNGKPALDWVVERQGVKIDKESGIVNDTNDWAVETMGNPRYPLELFQRVVTVSLETLRVVKGLPKLALE
jgi:hypothetical protein